MPAIETRPTAEITAKYLNPLKAGKKFASIKDDTDQFWLVRPGMFGQFSQGSKYKIEYSSRTDQQGTEWRTIEKVLGNAMAPMAQNNYRARSNPSESKQIAVLAIVKEWIGRIEVGDEDALVHALQVAMRAYDRTLGGTQAQRRDDLDDSLEF